MLQYKAKSLPNLFINNNGYKRIPNLICLNSSSLNFNSSDNNSDNLIFSTDSLKYIKETESSISNDENENENGYNNDLFSFNGDSSSIKQFKTSKRANFKRFLNNLFGVKNKGFI
ncbi:unnamed protein product [Candida verbasci]|uniref:Uncharacterized protein n=1 Tax=Candida verbasci TaxID=1227364 RepID=A0A9W4TYK9_9ASCO|nr:unnamed protein product [Candida verbasci]